MTISRTLSAGRDRQRGVWLWRAMSIALAVSVGACTAHQPVRAPPAAVPAPEPVAAAPAPQPQPQPAKPAPPKRAIKPVAPPAVVEAPPATPAIGVIGMSQDELRTALGEPAERIDQGPGQAWIYKTPSCTVEVMFFLDVTRNGYYALDRKVSGAAPVDQNSPAERACYSEIQNARHR